MKEIWKDIENYEGFYQVSNLGRVRSLDRFVKWRDKKYFVKGKLMKQIIGPWGYPWVSLRKDKTRKSKLVHILVAKAFIPNPLNLPIVNHKDENKTNAFAENLEWCTQQYNSVYNGVQNRKCWDNIVRAVTQYDKNMVKIKDWNSVSEASRYYNIPVTNIIACCKGKRKTSGTFIWKYKV